MGLYNTKYESAYVYACTTSRFGLSLLFSKVLKYFQCRENVGSERPALQKLSGTSRRILKLFTSLTVIVKAGSLRMRFYDVPRDLIGHIELLQSDVPRFSLVAAALFGSLKSHADVGSFSLSLRRFELMHYHPSQEESGGNSAKVVAIPCFGHPGQRQKYECVAKSCYEVLFFHQQHVQKGSTKVLYLEPHSIFRLSLWPDLSDGDKSAVLAVFGEIGWLLDSEQGDEKASVKNHRPFWQTKNTACFLMFCIFGIADDVVSFVKGSLAKTGVPLSENELDLSGMAHTWLENLANFEDKPKIRILSLNDNHIQDRDAEALCRELDGYPNLKELNIQFNFRKGSRTERMVTHYSTERECRYVI